VLLWKHQAEKDTLMKFLLVAINAKYIHSNPAIFSLRSYAGEELREHIELAEYTINQRMEYILSDIYKRKPDMIGFSCYIWNYGLVKQIVRELRKIRPDLPICLGGPEASFEYESLFAENPAVNLVMVGEGEATFKELLEESLKCYADILGDDLGRVDTRKFLQKIEDLEIPGTATVKGFHGERAPLSMNEIPFYYDRLSPEEEAANAHRIVYYESSRGCPFRCSYCLSSIDKTLRFRNIELVKQELQFFLDRKVPQVKFIDRTFNCNPGHALAIWKYIIENDNGVTNFHFEIAADLINEEELAVLKQMRPGLVQLEIGVQTTNETTLTAIRRKADLALLKDAVAKVRSFGNIHQHLDLIAGLPYEDLSSFRKSFEEVYEMQPQQLQLGFLKVLKGSEMYLRRKEYDILYQTNPMYEVLSTKWLSYEDVQELKKVEEMVEMFYNSNQFTYTLPALETLFSGSYEMFLALADYYEEKGYFVAAPARAHKYQVLLTFIEERFGAYTEWFRELLTFDYYLRENAKSRPEFARDISGYRQEISDYYKSQEQQPDVLCSYVEKGFDCKQMLRMTHMEVFSYPVWNVVRKGCTEQLQEMSVLSEGQKGDYRILFDYQKRNPLTYEAVYYVVDTN